VTFEPVSVPAPVLEVLADGQRQGLIGPGSLAPHVANALGFIETLARARDAELSTSDRVADLGAGGGLPSLVMASVAPGARFSLIEGSTRRARFLRGAVERCGLEGRVQVIAERAEVVGRNEAFRGRHSVVVARSFGSPATTAECGAPLLVVGGVLVVSEPPDEGRGSRWVAEGLRLLGLGLKSAGGRYAVLIAQEPCPERYPRRVGVPRKRPLF
jgi:16S rRNA (guanine527-N7)-methyltransferase